MASAWCLAADSAMTQKNTTKHKTEVYNMKRTMKTWKRWMLAIVSCVLALSLAACSSGKDPAETSATTANPSAPDATTEQKNNPNLEGSLQDILKRIYETADVSDDDRAWFSSMETTDITAANMSYYIGVQSDNVAEGIASEPMMSSVAYSLCLVRVKPGTDVEQLKANIKANVDPRKWICVEVMDENVLVENVGDVILLVMDDELAHTLRDAFLALK